MAPIFTLPLASSPKNVTLAPWPYPRFIAHRGGGQLAPENTLAGVEICLHHHYRMVEYDVKLCRDGVLVLFHDEALDRTTNGTGPVRTKTYAELATLDAGSWYSPDYAHARIPTLEEISRHTIAHDMASNIEIKPCPGSETETGTAVALAVRRLWQGITPPPLLSSFSDEALAAAHVAAPQIPRALLVKSLSLGWRDRLAQHDCIALHMHHSDITPAVVKEVHHAGYYLCAWTVNDLARAQQLLNWEIDALFTDILATNVRVSDALAADGLITGGRAADELTADWLSERRTSY